MSDNDINTNSAVTVYVGGYGDRRFKQWAKWVTAVDLSKTNGYAFEGEFLSLNRKHRLPVGAVILFYGRFGSAKHNKPAVEVCRVGPYGLETIFVKKPLDESWALDVMEDVAALLK